MLLASSARRASSSSAVAFLFFFFLDLGAAGRMITSAGGVQPGAKQGQLNQQEYKRDHGIVPSILSTCPAQNAVNLQKPDRHRQRCSSLPSGD